MDENEPRFVLWGKTLYVTAPQTLVADEDIEAAAEKVDDLFDKIEEAFRNALTEVDSTLHLDVGV